MLQARYQRLSLQGMSPLDFLLALCYTSGMNLFSKDYAYSGLSTVEAIEDAKHNIPRWLRWIARPSMIIWCDTGCGRTTKTSCKLVKGVWSGTDWHHDHELDFCPECWKNGSAELAIIAGIKPMGR